MRPARSLNLLPKSIWLLPVAAFAGLLAGVSPPDDHFQFAILGDRTGRAAPGVYERVWREIGQFHPDFVINVGDTIEGYEDTQAKAEWEHLRPLWSRFRFFCTPGNHDIWSPVSEKIYERETGRPPEYGFDFRQAHFTVLDNSRSEDLSEAQLRFLEQDLEEHRNRHPLFVFFHKPFWLLPLKLGSGDFRLHQIATKYGVSHVICGHGHQFVRIVRDGVVYLEVGSSGGSIARGLNAGQGFAEGWFYQHVRATVRGAAVQLIVQELDGRAIPAEDCCRQ